MAQSFFTTGDRGQGIADARAYGSEVLSLSLEPNPDVILLEYGLFPVEDARKIGEIASQSPLVHEYKLIIIAVDRLFHESQNALLKLFEEPPLHTVLVLVVPTEGQLLPTLRSRLTLLGRTASTETGEEHSFISASQEDRKKLVAKLLDSAKSGTDTQKQNARAEALRIVKDITRAVYAARTDLIYQISSGGVPDSVTSRERQSAMTLLLSELDTFTPLMHERSAPLKLIFEHLLIVLPPPLASSSAKNL